jgi:hypothetical protein
MGWNILFVGAFALLYTIELTLVSDGDDSSAFLAMVYSKQDGAIGSITDTISGILAKSNNGGTKILCMTMSCFTDAISSDQSARSASWRRYFRCP